jgi:(R,R)-butanediol dehydrogenase/meso-butanediol dehydrogenase/diacetyl reductase
MTAMKATRYYGKHDIRTEEIPEPEVMAGYVKVKNEWTGICGTDLHEYDDGPMFCPAPGVTHSLTGVSLPIVLGHEIAGVVSEIGEGVTKVKVGDRVSVEPYVVCNKCEFCLEGRYNICTSAAFLGLSAGSGGFAEFCVAEERFVHPLGDLSTEVGALVEPLAVAHHAIVRSGVKAGQTAAVIGAGPIGLFVTAILKAIGVETVYNVEISAIRKEKAAASGSTLVIDPTQEDAVAKIHELTGGRGVDVAFEAVGASPALQTAIDVTKTGGNVVNISIWSRKAEIDLFGLVAREVNLMGTLAYCNDHAAVIKLLQEGKLTNVEQYITGRISAEDVVVQGIEQLINNKEEHVKILVHP